MTKARDLASGLNGVRPFAMAAGDGATSAASGTATVTFPSGRFTQTPIVTATSTSSAFALFAEAYNASTTSVTVAVETSSGPNLSSRAFSWTAVQMTSGSGAG